MTDPDGAPVDDLRPVATDNSVKIGTAETVNVPGDIASHPAVIYIVALVSIGVLLGFGWVTWVVLSSPTTPTEGGAIAIVGIDPATKGAVIQTWNNLAVGAAAVWTASHLVSKLKGPTG